MALHFGVHFGVQVGVQVGVRVGVRVGAQVVDNPITTPVNPGRPGGQWLCLTVRGRSLTSLGSVSDSTPMSR